MEGHQSKGSSNSKGESESILSDHTFLNVFTNHPKDEVIPNPLVSPRQCNKENEGGTYTLCNGLNEADLGNEMPTNNLAFIFDKQCKNGIIATNLSYLNNNIPDVTSKESPPGLDTCLELGLVDKNKDSGVQYALSKTENVLESQVENEVVNNVKKLPNEYEPKEELPGVVNEVQNDVSLPDDKLPVEKEQFNYIQEMIKKISDAVKEEFKNKAACEDEEVFEIFEDKGIVEEEKEEEEVQEIPRGTTPVFDVYEANSPCESNNASKFQDSYLTIDLYDCDSDDEPVPSEEELKLLYDSSDLDDDDNNDELIENLPNKRKFDDNDNSVLSSKKFKIEDDILTIEEQPDFITMTVHSDKEGTRTVETEESSRELPLEDEPPVENFEHFNIVKKIQHREEVEYVSQDLKENEDNYNKEWLKLKERIGSNEAERYKAIRERWRNLSIPNPSVNLTFRHVNNPNEKVEEKEKNNNCTNIRGRNHQRTRSCTTFYENIISQVNNKYESEKQRIIDKNNIDVFKSRQAKDWEVNLAVLNANNPIGQQNLRVTIYKHQQILLQLENACMSSIENLESQRQEEIAFFQRYIDEVRAFNSFYQGLTVHEDNLLLTPDQHEHLAETERMYCEFSKFYDPN